MIIIHGSQDPKGGIGFSQVDDKYFQNIPTDNLDQWFDALPRETFLEYVQDDEYHAMYNKIISENKYVVALDINENLFDEGSEDDRFFTGVLHRYVDGVRDDQRCSLDNINVPTIFYVDVGCDITRFLKRGGG